MYPSNKEPIESVWKGDVQLGRTFCHIQVDQSALLQLCYSATLAAMHSAQPLSIGGYQDG